MFARRGESTPPTILQTFFFRVGLHRTLIDPEHHMYQVMRHFHPLDQGADQLPLAQPVGGLQACVYSCSELFEAPNDQAQFRLQGGFIGETLALLFQMSDPLAQAGDPGFEFLFLDEPLGITVNQPGKALPEFPQLGFDGGVLLPFRTGGRV